MILIIHWLIIILCLIFIFFFIPILEGFERYKFLYNPDKKKFRQILKSVIADYRKYYCKFAQSLSIREFASIHSIPLVFAVIIALLPVAPSFNSELLVASDLDASLIILIVMICLYFFVNLKFQEHKLISLVALIIFIASLLCILADSQNFKISQIVINQITESQDKTKIFSFLPSWLIFRQPINFILFLSSGIVVFNQLSITSERNYRGLNIIKTQSLFIFSSLITVLFLGSWHFKTLPITLSDNISEGPMILLCLVVFAIKFLIVLFFLLVLKNSLIKFNSITLKKIFLCYMLPISLIHLALFLLFY